MTKLNYIFIAIVPFTKLNGSSIFILVDKKKLNVFLFWDHE